MTRDEVKAELGAFTDGCTFCPDSLWIWDGWRPRRVSLLGACAIHDQRYQIGGTEEDRAIADEELRDAINVATKFQRRVAAQVIFEAVRRFGASHFTYRDTAA